ncbi:hypothetical protein EE612_027894 [Oryza sativa]|nr:hypothetical protein EE612_027894 [Oryza sativa]
MWPNAKDEWETFFAPLRYGFEGSMILVTTRSPDVANLVASNNCNPFRIEGLDRDIFWEFFKKCAFGKQCPESYPQLHDIGRSIASRLCGSPLAAKTIGRLLNMELTVQHWKTVQNKELWELPNRDNDILPALQLSYLHLPQELKSCFAFCSMFPKGYSFERDEIVGMWVAQGFVAPEGSMRLEDIGIRYLDDLRGRFLLQTDTNCLDQSRYVMHDLIHDMAQSISVDKCFLMQDLSYQNQRRMPHAVRYMSVEVDSESLSQTRDIQYLNKLHSLKFGTILMFEITWFNQLSNILFLSLKGCMLVRLPDSIGELHSLRYLDISRSHVQELPEKLWCLYCLQVLDASSSSLEVISPDVTKLINLRRLAVPMGCSPKLSEISGLGNMSLLRNLIHFTVGIGNGRKISELKGMNQLSGTLTISSIYNVKSKEEAVEARLIDKQYLQALVLLWRDQPVPRVMNDDNGVAEGLCPPSRIQRLNVDSFAGDSFSPSWFNPESLPTLRMLELRKCIFLRSLSIPSLPSLEELRLTSLGVEVLTIFCGSTGGGRMLQQASSSIRRSNAISCLTRSPPWSSPSTRRRLSGSSAKPDGHKDGGGGTLPSRGCPAAGDTGGFSAAADHRRWRPDGRRSGSAHAGCGSAFPGAKSSLPAVRSGLGDPNDGGPRGDGGKRRRTVVERWQAAEGWRDSRERPAGSWATAATATLLGPTRYGGVAQETHGDDGNSRQLAGGAVPAGWPAGDTARGRGATEAARGGGCMAERLMAMVATAGSQREE